MNRKVFLTNFWNKVLKPILFLIVGAYCVYFLYRALFESGNERNLLLLLTSLALIYVLLYVTGRLFRTAIVRIIPISWRRAIRDGLRIISPLIFLFLIYVSWQQDQFGTLILLVILLAENFLHRSPRQAI